MKFIWGGRLTNYLFAVYAIGNEGAWTRIWMGLN